MPTGRVRCLGESPALVSAGPPIPSRLPAEETSTTTEPRIRACGTVATSTVSLREPRSLTRKFREPGFTPVSERRLSRESDGPGCVSRQRIASALRYNRDVFRYGRLRRR